MRNRKSLIKSLHLFLFLCLSFSLGACGFHLQGETKLAPPLHRMYLQANDPYGALARTLRQYLKLSKIQLVSSPAQAETVLVILSDDATQQLTSVSGTQQTRQYILSIVVTFEINNAEGQTLVPPQILREDRVMTTQSNQVLGSSNEANLLYFQMRRAVVYAIMNRLASKEVTRILMDKTANTKKPKSGTPLS